MNTLDIPSKEKKKMNTLDNSLLDFGILIVGLIGFFFFFLWVFRRNWNRKQTPNIFLGDENAKTLKAPFILK